MSNAAREKWGSEGWHLKHPHRNNADLASLTRFFNSLFHITARYLAIQDMRRLQTYFTNRSSHLPEANRCKLSLTSSLSSSHMGAGIKPTSKAKFNINLDATSVLSSDIPPLHSHICSIESVMLLPCLCTPTTRNGNWKQLSSKFKSSWIRTVTPENRVRRYKR